MTNLPVAFFFFPRSERRVRRLGWFWGRREAFFPARCCGRAGAVQKLPWTISDARLQQLECCSQKVVCLSLSQAHETGEKGCRVHKLFSPDNFFLKIDLFPAVCTFPGAVFSTVPAQPGTWWELQLWAHSLPHVGLWWSSVMWAGVRWFLSNSALLLFPRIVRVI